jgi:hypothetical protein
VAPVMDLVLKTILKSFIKNILSIVRHPNKK